METLLASRRRAGWMRSVLVIATLIIAVLIHHSIDHSASTGSGGAAAMPGMAAATVASHDHRSGTMAEASETHMGCSGDQMCEASGIAKSPSTAHAAATASRSDPPQPKLTVGVFKYEPGAASSPPTSAVLRI